jgi:hypothetical protein
MLFLAAGCSTPSTVESRRQEKLPAYTALPEDQKARVDKGEVVVGMDEDAVYIALGKPAQVLKSADANGAIVTWLYEGLTTEDYIGWRYATVLGRKGAYTGTPYLTRDTEYSSYISAELVFRGGKLESFRELPKPPNKTYYRN